MDYLCEVSIGGLAQGTGGCIFRRADRIFGAQFRAWAQLGDDFCADHIRMATHRIGVAAFMDKGRADLPHGPLGFAFAGARHR